MNKAPEIVHRAIRIGLALGKSSRQIAEELGIEKKMVSRVKWGYQHALADALSNFDKWAKARDIDLTFSDEFLGLVCLIENYCQIHGPSEHDENCEPSIYLGNPMLGRPICAKCHSEAMEEHWKRYMQAEPQVSVRGSVKLHKTETARKAAEIVRSAVEIYDAYCRGEVKF